MSVVSIGSKVDASGAVGPEVSAQRTLGEMTSIVISRRKNTAIAFKKNLLRIMCN
jgi:hypothetical protein